jgi:hypothetical protein
MILTGMPLHLQSSWYLLLACLFHSRKN